MSFGGPFGAIMDMAGKIPDYMHDEEMQNDQQEFNRDEAFKTRDFNSAEAVRQRDFQERMRATQYQTAVADLKAAGLNPMLAAHQGGAGTPSGGMATASNASSGIASSASGRGTNFAAALQSASQTEVNHEIVERTKAETEKIRAEKGEIEARTPTHAVSIDQMRQNINESIERIEDIRQRVITGSASATNLAQQTENLKATLPQIEATIQQLRAQTKQTGALTGKTNEETKEIRQRISATLPQLEAALKQLEQQAKQLDMPRREQESAQNERFQGAFGALLRILNPLNNFLR